jgi:hypothetical protein
MTLLIVTTIPAVGIKNEYRQLEEQHVLKSFNIKAEETIILNPIADSSVLEDIPDSNFGNLDALLLLSSADGNERIYLKFDLSSIPDGAKVTKVWLRLYCFSALDDSVDAWMWGIEGAWDELSITWNNQPFDPESDTPISIRMMTLDDSESWCDWPLSPEDLQPSEQNLMIKTEPESIGGRYRFDSRESGENLPELVITYTKPKSIIINTPILNFLESHPNLFPLLQKLLQQPWFGL